MAGFVLANGSMSSNQSGEGEIRKAIVENDLVDCMVALPSQLFYMCVRTRNPGTFAAAVSTISTSLIPRKPEKAAA